jgi:transformer-2 protein
MYDPHSREPRGFAFVTMDGAEAAEAAIAGMSGVELLGRTLSVQKVRLVKGKGV